MKARDLMKTEHMWTCSTATDVRQVAKMMLEHDIGVLPVLDEQGRLEGIVTDRDIALRLVAQGRSLDTPISEIMSKPVHTIHPDADAREVEMILERYRIRRLPVVDENNEIQGVISIADLAHKYHGFMREHRLAEVLDTVSSPA